MPEHVQDKCHTTVAHDGCARVKGKTLQLLSQRLDHDLLRVVNAVHDKPKLAIFRLQDHHADRFGSVSRSEPQHLIQICDGQKAPAPAIDWRPMHIFDMLSGGVTLQTDQFKQADLWNHESFPAASYDKAGNDGQGERDPDFNRGAFAAAAEEVDNAADLFDVGLHHIHANAAPGDVGHRLGRGESGEEDQIVASRSLSLSACSGGEGPSRRLSLHPLNVDAGAVVGNLNVDLPSFVKSPEGEPAL